ncbi:chemotaxis protein CheB [Roseomonas indoligenes]|uniref:protein-glutamate methylesterase n=1 Tax=Roseomonas indoligenes TaxID=2820811 RepID=A0A940N3I3_9PROT|nr:chemotaxis protein CheB [Pararoseomonas indoligenes]MBP0495346.1 chemotaxis protein CheB [Pararoseomonas indoligenes]
MTAAQRDVVAIGGSLGSGAVLRRLLIELPADFPAAILITTHMPSNGPVHLAETLALRSRIPVRQAVDGQPIEPGQVIVAAPNRHLLAVDGAVVLGTGPRENMTRPAIDPLFRSVALTYGPRAVGLVLSGLLNDGASGLYAIKAMGGTAMAQHPLDAEAGDMPRAALEAVEADAVGRAEELAGMLASIAGTPAGPSLPPAPELELEVAIAIGRRLGSDQLRSLADPAPLTCPHCHGVLSEVKGGGPLRYRCQIGHAFTAEAIVASQEAGVGDALRIAMRVMEERVELVARMAKDARETGRRAVAELYEARAAEYAGYAATLRRAVTMDLRMARPAEDLET